MELKNKRLLVSISFGLIISVLIFLAVASLVAKDSYNYKIRDYERFKLCEPCGMTRNLSCVVDVCNKESERLYYVPGYANQRLSLEGFKNASCSQQVDMAHESSIGFINEFCGHDRWNGYNYGEKPNIIENFFEGNTFKDTLGGFAMFGFIGLGVLISPSLLGLIIGIILYLKTKENA